MNRIFPRFFQPIDSSFFLFGPRGTGKSTWLRKYYPNALYIDLLNSEQMQFYSAMPTRLLETLDAYPDKKCIVLDEIQRVPELLFMVHLVLEKKMGYQFILTGSSARKLKKEGADLLAGRAIMRKMHPFFAAELGSLFNLEKALQLGLLPVVVDASDPKQVMRTYASMYLQEEIQREGLVRNVGSFSRFMEVISFSHASQLVSTNIARECDVTRHTVETYIQILKDLLLAFTLPVFVRRAKRELVSHEKFYLFDAGVFHSFRPKGPFDIQEELQGLALEGLVAQHLKAWIDYQPDSYTFAYWRTKTNLEVDFVIYGPLGLWAIEVKNNRRYSPKDFHGLKAFCKDYPEAKGILLYRGKERAKVEGIWCLPCDDFLRAIVPDQSIANDLIL